MTMDIFSNARRIEKVSTECLAAAKAVLAEYKAVEDPMIFKMYRSNLQLLAKMGLIVTGITDPLCIELKKKADALIEAQSLELKDLCGIASNVEPLREALAPFMDLDSEVGQKVHKILVDTLPIRMQQRQEQMARLLEKSDECPDCGQSMEMNGYICDNRGKRCMACA